MGRCYFEFWHYAGKGRGEDTIRGIEERYLMHPVNSVFSSNHERNLLEDKLLWDSLLCDQFKCCWGSQSSFLRN